MDTKYKLVRPVTLVEGDEYLFNEQHEAAGEPALVHVIFIAYCSSLVFVIVSNGNERLRCPRDDVFMRAWSNAESPSGSAHAFRQKSPLLFHLSKIETTGQISIDESELQMDFVQASGPGGQNVNTLVSEPQKMVIDLKRKCIYTGMWNYAFSDSRSVSSSHCEVSMGYLRRGFSI